MSLSHYYNELDYDDDGNYLYFNMDPFNEYFLIEIVDLVFNIKENFSHIPYFLSYLNAQRLIDLFILYNINVHNLKNLDNTLNYVKSKYHYEFYLFCEELDEELFLCFNTINKFLKNLKFNQISNYNHWQLFCFKYSDISSL